MALLLREADVEAVADLDAIISAVAAATRDLGRGEAQNQPRRRVFPPGGVLNVMFASWPGGRVTGLKAYTIGGGQVRFLVTLFDLEGAPIAMIEANRLGALRTGAATGVAARALAGRGPKIVAVIGTGWQAKTQVAALRACLEVSELRVYGRDEGRRARFAQTVGGRAAGSAEECVRGADVVVTITTSAVPVLEAAWVKPEALVVGAGCNIPSRSELPADLVKRCRAVVVDQRETAELESGDLLSAGYDFAGCVDLGAVLAGTVGLPASGGPLLFESHGLALWDLAAATTLLKSARTAGRGEEVGLFRSAGERR
ncbi:MAG: ornithine cyclodeaminase family protein [Candidatus Dormibacteraeota bacterium]|nr:ornithine cyclodeaminase family protein [Candidatus Dormibacteraeota bacterium]